MATPPSETPVRWPCLPLALIVVLLLGYSASMEVTSHKIYFFSDEATYHSMAYSLAHDGDLEYELEDLSRVYALGYDGGPTGLFLKRDPLSGRLYFAKAFLYPAVAAPFVWLFGDNGFFVLHSLLLAGVFVLGYAYLRRELSAALSALYVATFILASVAFVYFFWMTPEWFHLALVFLAVFLWLYKRPMPGGEPPDRLCSGWLGGFWTDVAAATLLGALAYSKLPMAAYVLALVAWELYRRRWRRAFTLVAAAVVTCVALFGLTTLATGDWNYQGGHRKSFAGPYPLQSRAASFEHLGTPMVTKPGDVHPPTPATLAADAVYVWIGRNGGLLLYMFPGVLAVVLFLARWRRGRTPLASPHALLLGACLLQAAFFMMAISGNWIGGGGTLGNRYFMALYPALFFLLPTRPGLWGAITSWMIAGLFLAQILLNPFFSSHYPSSHTKSFPFTLFPSELTLLHNLPFNTNPRARRVALEESPSLLLYFFDDNTYLREPDFPGFWVRGGRTAEVVVRTEGSVDRLVFELRNGATENRVQVTVEGRTAHRRLEPHARWEVDFPVGDGWLYEGTRLYRFTVTSSSGFVPLLTPGASSDHRHLGVMVLPRVEPAVPLW